MEGSDGKEVADEGHPEAVIARGASSVSSLTTVLAEIDPSLACWAPQLVAYGAWSAEDLRYLDESDAEILGMPRLQIRKLIHKVHQAPLGEKSDNKQGGRVGVDISARNTEKDRKGTNLSVQEVVEGWTDSSSFYDEIRKPDGTLREMYAELKPIADDIERKQPERVSEFVEQSLKDFKGDNKLYHIPRMLSQEESNVIYNGVVQRAKAIQAFLVDHYSQGKRSKYLTDRVIPKPVIKALLKRNDERLLARGIDRKFSAMKEAWGFWYGPDIIRGPRGDFFVCEDNLGYVGGMGDLVVAQRSLLKAFPEYKPCIDAKAGSPMKFYEDMVRDHRAAVRAGEKIVLLHYPRHMWPDKEEGRVIRLFRKLGVETVEIPVPGRKRKGKYVLEVKNGDGLYLVRRPKSPRKSQGGSGRRGRSKSPGRKHDDTTARVGLIIIDAEIYDVDPKNTTTRRKSILDEARYWTSFYAEESEKLQKMFAERKEEGRHGKRISRKIERLKNDKREIDALLAAYQESRRPRELAKIRQYLKRNRRDDFMDLLNQGLPGVLDLYFQGQVKMINGPGFDFLGDKQFCMYVDRLVEYYLKEEPILKSIPTLSFAEHCVDELLRAVFDNPDMQKSVVIKRVDGRGGDSVWVGPMIPRDQFRKVRDMIQSEPAAFLVQKYIALSQVDGQLTDLRNLACVRRDSLVVSRTLWSRGVPSKDSNGKVNISDCGFEFAVCIATSPSKGSSEN